MAVPSALVSAAASDLVMVAEILGPEMAVASAVVSAAASGLVTVAQILGPGRAARSSHKQILDPQDECSTRI